MLWISMAGTNITEHEVLLPTPHNCLANCISYVRSDRMAQLLDERDLGVLTSVMSLFVSLVSNNAEAYWNCLPKCVRILERMARNQDIPQEYTYYGIPSPWLQVFSFLSLAHPAWLMLGLHKFVWRLLNLFGHNLLKSCSPSTLIAYLWFYFSAGLQILYVWFIFIIGLWHLCLLPTIALDWKKNVNSCMLLSVICYRKHLNLWSSVCKCDVNY